MNLTNEGGYMDEMTLETAIEILEDDAFVSQLRQEPELASYADAVERILTAAKAELDEEEIYE